LKKLMLLAALLAMLALAAVPVIAQVTQEDEQEGESAELNQDFSATQEGDNSTQCVGIQGVGNTGNTQNITDILQYGSTADEFEFEEVGGTITVSPTNTTTCTDKVQQAASASGSG
jgi:type II secretory pathway pseudopilin PulG